MTSGGRFEAWKVCVELREADEAKRFDRDDTYPRWFH
jgi:hypothetical protein